MKILLFVVALVLALSFTGCVNQEVVDAGITAKVTGKLAADPDTSATKIDVDTANGVVTLSGAVVTENEKAEAELIAKNTDGVLSVVNKLTVNPEAANRTIIGETAEKTAGEVANKAEEMTEKATAGASAAISDATILSKIKTQHLSAGIIGINVDVKDGAVTLKGVVENAERKSWAEELARRTEGVKSVQNLLTTK